MREPKYQAWLIDKNVMVDVMGMNLQEKYILYYDLSDCKNSGEAFDRLYNDKPNAECVFEHCKLREYTGLKDKNGREIYEGDLIKVSDHPFEGSISIDGIYEVKYNNLMELCAGSWLLHRLLYCSMVIGNIYEDGDLLGKS